MARLTKFDRLPVEIRELIAQRRREGTTIRGIQSALAELAIKVSNGSLGLYTKRLDAIEAATRRAGLSPVLSELRRCRVALEALCEHLGMPKPPL